MREWLFNVVARELSLKGAGGVNLDQLAAAGGLTAQEARRLFPDKRALMIALVNEICAAQKEYIAGRCQDAASPKERLVCFISSSFDFVDYHPNLAEAIVLALLGSDAVVKEQVHDQYARLYATMLDDLVSEEIIPNKSLPLLSDLTQILLSLTFLGGCPWLQMDYLSFVNPQDVAVSALEAMKKRYAMDEFRTPA
jgi:AcrR family transcriptional regulator